MRMMLKVQMGLSEANEAVKDGRLEKTMEDLMAQLKPEAAYHTVERGRRTALIFFDMTETWRMPLIGEPLFQVMGARISLTPVMNTDELRAGLQAYKSGA